MNGSPLVTKPELALLVLWAVLIITTKIVWRTIRGRS